MAHPSIVDIPYSSPSPPLSDHQNYIRVSPPIIHEDDSLKMSPKPLSPALSSVSTTPTMASSVESTATKPKRKFNIESLIDIEPDEVTKKKSNMEEMENQLALIKQQQEFHFHQQQLQHQQHHHLQLIRQFSNYELPPPIHPLLMMSPLAMKALTNINPPTPYLHHYQQLRLDSLANRVNLAV